MSITNPTSPPVAADSARVYTGVTAPTNSAASLVDSGWAQAQQFAGLAFSSAIGYLNTLSAAAKTINNLPTVNSALTVGTLLPTPFAGVVPVVPANTAIFTEVPYTSAYLTSLQVQLNAWATGAAATGISPLVEQAIWQRELARENVLAARKIAEASRTFGSRGFPAPPGDLRIATQEAIQTAADAASKSSREVAIKQADLEQTNRRFAMEQAWKVEEAMISYTNQQMARAIEYVKTIQTYLTTVYHEQVNMYQADVQAYSAVTGAAVAVFKAQHEVRVEEGRLRIEASRANALAMIQQATLMVESIKAGASVSAQLAASALSAVNISGSVSASISESAQSSVSSGVSTSYGVSLQPDLHKSDVVQHNLSTL